MLHAAGAMHEQSREDDRDKTITLNWDSIPRQLEMNYRGYKTANAREYDLGSVLQYPLKVRISCQTSKGFENMFHFRNLNVYITFLDNHRFKISMHGFQKISKLPHNLQII